MSRIPLYPMHGTPYVGGTPPGVVTVDAAGIQRLVPADQVGAQGPDVGIVETEAGEALGGHRVVKIAATAEYASADDAAGCDQTLGVTTGAAAKGASVTVRTYGALTELTWTWTSGPVYLGLAGQLTQTPPASGVVLQIGTAETATRIFVNPQIPIRRA